MPEKNSQRSLAAENINLRSLLICMFLIVAGVLLILFQDELSNDQKIKDVIYSFGLTFINIGVVSFAYESYIRNRFKKIILDYLQTTLDAYFSVNARPLIDEINCHTQQVVNNFEPPIFNILKGQVFSIYSLILIETIKKENSQPQKKLSSNY